MGPGSGQRAKPHLHLWKWESISPPLRGFAPVIITCDFSEAVFVQSEFPEAAESEEGSRLDLRDGVHAEVHLPQLRQVVEGEPPQRVDEVPPEVDLHRLRRDVPRHLLHPRVGPHEHAVFVLVKASGGTGYRHKQDADNWKSDAMD